MRKWMLFFVAAFKRMTWIALICECGKEYGVFFDLLDSFLGFHINIAMINNSMILMVSSHQDVPALRFFMYKSIFFILLCYSGNYKLYIIQNY
ncbi:hypothetical protein BDA99DRAFT_498625 [Phascolomyces articulosus]|uniref:Secreted protein n=1 Tax=Phascolomyces articulosus TaxID=60185 RepID=A0AAD5KLZ3_9FUNG|nr:hypothetical protein BDA99DRAFT_498625 [Phascolomyces articulosus]